MLTDQTLLHFRFELASVQKQIWVEVGGKLDFGKDEHAAYKAFEKMSDRIGWRIEGEWLKHLEFVSIKDSPIAHLPFRLTVDFGQGFSSLASRLVKCSL